MQISPVRGRAKSVSAFLAARLRHWTRKWNRLCGRVEKRALSHVYSSDIKNKTRAEWAAAVKEDPETAARWVYAAAVGGYIDAQLAWAQMQLDGLGTARDAEGAFRWFSIAAQSGHADAVNMLGRCYERGWGTPADMEKAVAHYRQAASMSFAWAQFNLASMLLDGRGVAQDTPGAFALFKAAAAQGHIKSFHMIGRFFEHGLACPRDQEAALFWYRRAAEAGEFRGQYHFGLLLVASGKTQEGIDLIRAAISTAPGWFRLEIRDNLLGHPLPVVNRLAMAP